MKTEQQKIHWDFNGSEPTKRTTISKRKDGKSPRVCNSCLMMFRGTILQSRCPDCQATYKANHKERILSPDKFKVGQYQYF